MAEATKLPVKQAQSSGEARAVQRGWAPLNHLRREFDQFFDRFGGTAWPGPFHRMVDMGNEMAAFSINPAFAFAEADKVYEITAELPGLEEKDIEIKLSNHTLQIKGQKREEKDAQEQDYYFSERRYGFFLRAFELPESVDTAKIEASFSKGILKITLPKSAEAQKSEKKIEIKAA